MSLEAEAEAITWAVDQGAQVINLSLGGVRDPDDPSARHVLAARARRDRLRVLEGRGRRVGGRQRRRLAGDAVELRRLAGGAAARDRRRRAAPGRLRPGVLEPRPALRRPRRARRRHLLDDPAQPDRPDARRVHGIPYSDCGPPDSTATRSARRSPRRRSSAAAALLLGVDPTLTARPGRVAARALGDRRHRPPAAAKCMQRPRLADRAGAGSTCSPRSRRSAEDAASRRPDAYEPNDDAGRRRTRSGRRARSPPRSTTGTTRPTSTSIKLAKGERLSAQLTSSLPLGRHAALGAGDETGDGPARAGEPGRTVGPVSANERLSYRAPPPASTSCRSGSPSSPARRPSTGSFSRACARPSSVLSR